MWVLILVVVLLWLMRPAAPDPRLAQLQAEIAAGQVASGGSAVTGAELAAIQALNRQGLPAPAANAVLRASGLVYVGDHATEISDPGLARDPSSINGGSV